MTFRAGPLPSLAVRRRSPRLRTDVAIAGLLNQIGNQMTLKDTVAYMLFVTAAACSTNRAAVSTNAAVRGVPDGSSLIAAMHNRYANTWYKTLRFRQTVTITRNGQQEPPQVWLEHAMIPGYLRIDQAHDYSGNGVIYGPDSLYAFQKGNIVARRKERNPLMVLGFDVYRQPVARSLQVLQEAGYNMSKLRTDTWEGKPVYVVGADAGDLHSRQFWIEQDRMLFVRAFEPSGRDSAHTTEYRFDNYQPAGKGWLAVTCVFLTDGKEFDREEYFDIVVNPALPAGIMDPAQWGKVKLN